MNVLLVQFENWQTAMEDFQKNIEKELEEIRRHKAEVRQMKIDLIDHLGQGRYVRDENRIIISAPEIIIGDTDKSGMLQNGSSRVIIRANNINLEGVGSGATDTGSIINRRSKPNNGLLFITIYYTEIRCPVPKTYANITDSRTLRSRKRL